MQAGPAWQEAPPSRQCLAEPCSRAARFPGLGALPGVLRVKPRPGPGPARPVGYNWPERRVGWIGACLGRGEERRWGR